MTSRALLTCMLVLIASTTARADTWYVPSESCPTIQAGIDSAAYNQGPDVVQVAAGTYKDYVTREDTITANVIIGRVGFPPPYNPDSTVLVSESGPESTIVDGGGDHWVVFCRDVVDREIVGFRIQNGKNQSGKGWWYMLSGRKQGYHKGVEPPRVFRRPGYLTPATTVSSTTVVRAFLPRIAPCMPICRISRSTVHRATSTPSRLSRRLPEDFVRAP
jgi:hypothetical protein